ncbi:MAG TPA: methionine--tRNA ligase [Alphaproteobacteria bacterium]|nr:methionine--tRNA ligase [Alphaproteobacteria bacterium]
MTVERSFYITTPIFYVNDVPHIGHAYNSIACDVLARFMRLDGYRVKFLTGTDEHGQKVEKSARAAGMEPKAFCDKVAQNFRDMDRLLNLSNDDFIRTTEPRHARACQDLWRRLKARDEIYLGTYAGWYAVRDEAFHAEGELTTGPDGIKRAPSGAEVEWVEEPNYFFRLSKWQAPLLALYKKNPAFLAPDHRRNEVVSFVAGGLKDLPVSRPSLKWGVPVPDDPKHVMYVWLDALTNYLTALGYPDMESRDYSEFWPEALHVVGKDILRFHAVYWPAFLMAAELEPPRRIFAHGWLLNRGEKMSKSLGNVVRPGELIAQYGLDPVRYYLLREIPFGADGYISHETMVARINGDLANDLGNLVQRVLSMINRNCSAAIPQPGSLTAADTRLLEAAETTLAEMRGHMAEQAFHRALEALWRVIGQANRYVDEQAPWALRKTDPARMGTVLYVLADAIRHIGTLALPFMPASGARILDQLALPADARSFASLGPHGRLQPGTLLPKPEGVFPRYLEPEPGAEAGVGR